MESNTAIYLIPCGRYCPGAFSVKELNNRKYTLLRYSPREPFPYFCFSNDLETTDKTTDEILTKIN